MKGWNFYGPGDFRLEEIEMPEIKTDEVLLKVLCVQLSVTELEALSGQKIPYASEKYDAMLQNLQNKQPITNLGHEFCGEVVEIGKDVDSKLRKGDRVYGIPNVPCGRCKVCLSGFRNLCQRPLTFQGCLRELINVNAESLVVTTPSISESEVAAMQPLASAISAVTDAKLDKHDSVAVIGCGSVGLNVLQLVRSKVGNVIAVDVEETKLRLAQHFKSDNTVNSVEIDPVEEINSLTDHLGVDVVFECAGGSPSVGLAGGESFEQATRIAKINGRVIQVAAVEKIEPSAQHRMRKKSLRWIFPTTLCDPFDRLNDYVFANKLVSLGQIDLKTPITHKLHGIDKIPTAIEITRQKQKHKAGGPAQVLY